MYTILFHIAGIAILEISFYFYYVGPMETKMFENTVRQLMNEPINNINSQLVTVSKLNQILYILYDIPLTKQDNLILYDTQNITSSEMIQMRDHGMVERSIQNHDLYIKSIKYWLILCAVSVITFIIQYKLRKIRKIKKENGLGTVVSNEGMGIELEYVRSYRKGSIDESSSNSLMDNSSFIPKMLCDASKIEILKKTIYYLLFGVSILTFQYLFFQNIVYYYKPLSIEEVKYIMYESVTAEIKT